jgi:hypothetical protein
MHKVLRKAGRNSNYQGRDITMLQQIDFLSFDHDPKPSTCDRQPKMIQAHISSKVLENTFLGPLKLCCEVLKIPLFDDLKVQTSSGLWIPKDGTYSKLNVSSVIEIFGVCFFFFF